MILKSVEDQGKNLNREVREFGVIRRTACLTACLTSRKIQEKGGEEGVERADEREDGRTWDVM